MWCIGLSGGVSTHDASTALELRLAIEVSSLLLATPAARCWCCLQEYYSIEHNGDRFKQVQRRLDTDRSAQNVNMLLVSIPSRVSASDWSAQVAPLLL